jgi:class 3 adenylate cyclase
LAEKILTARGALEGERKHVTVLLADIQGSLKLIEGIDPEEVRTLLDPALHAMMDAVHRYEGTVNQVMGDGIMALFGAPVAMRPLVRPGVVRRAPRRRCCCSQWKSMGLAVIISRRLTIIATHRARRVPTQRTQDAC